MSWTPIVYRCDAKGQCMNTHEETIYYSVNYGQWTRISVVIDEDTSSRFVYVHTIENLINPDPYAYVLLTQQHFNGDTFNFNL